MCPTCVSAPKSTAGWFIDRDATSTLHGLWEEPRREGLPRGSVYEQPPHHDDGRREPRLPGRAHFKPICSHACTHGAFALYKRRVAIGLPAAPLAQCINGLKAAERELWRLLIGSGSNGTCGGGGTSAMG